MKDKQMTLESIAYNVIGYMLCEGEMELWEICEYIGCTMEDLEKYGLLE